MLNPHFTTRLAMFLAVLCFGGSLMAEERAPMTKETLSKESVVQFLNRFEELAEKENFDLIQDMIHENAFFRFNDGDFVGRQAVRGAFEKTWKGSPNIKKERFYLSDIVVLSLDSASATATYTYNWEGVMDGRAFRIQGRGTRVLVREQSRLQIVHEHLSRFPKQ